MAKFDIIVPVHNTKRYLSACIESVLNQDYSDYKLIIVDDNSTDGSLELLRNYEEKYPDKILLIESPQNMGGIIKKSWS